MTNAFHVVRQVLNGNLAMDNRIKYRGISIAISVIHMFYAITFGKYSVEPLFYYNIGATIFYLYHVVVTISKERYVLFYISSFVEIIFHAAMAVILLGWDWGFMTYTIALIPVAYYLTYTMPQFKDRISIPVISSVSVVVSYVLVRAFCGRVEPFYPTQHLPNNMQISFYYFNTIITFALMVVFCTLFATEIRYMQRQLELENRRLGELANFDPLTHLMNRRSMNVQLQSAHDVALSVGQMFCVMLVDIDDFKKVNDTYGHDCGDEVLVSIANTISGDVREDDAVCRWGGEEILILIKADLDIARQVAERICKDVRETVVEHNDVKVSVTLTIGVADYKKNQTIRSMIEEADRNLYYGKHNGKNQVVTSHERL